MLTEIRLSNFQGFGESVKVPLAPITVVFGPNSSGKSSILKSLLLMKQTWSSTTAHLSNIELNGEFVDLGSFETCVFSHDVKRDICLGFSSFKGVGLDLKIGPDSKIRSLLFSGLWGVSKKSSQRRIEHELPPAKGGRLLLERVSDSDELFRITNLSELSDKTALMDDCRSFIQEEGKSRNLPELNDDVLLALKNLRFRLRGGFRLEPLSEYEFDDLDNSIRTNLFAEFFSQLFTENLRFVGSDFSDLIHSAGLRAVPGRFTTLGNSSLLAPDGSNVQDLLNQESKLIEKSSDWIFKLSGGRYRLELIPFKNDELGFLGNLGTIALRDMHLGILATFKDVGTGLSQVLPIIAALATASARKGTFANRHLALLTGSQSLALFEQPELHLHPLMQADLADLFLQNSCALDSEKPQILIETHSENLILRLQKRVREGVLSNSDVALVYVHKDSDSGQSAIQHLELDTNGDFKNDWDAAREFSELRLHEII